MNPIIEQLESEQLRSDLPDIEPGDTVRVSLRITEGEGNDQRTRTQVYEGVVIGRQGRSVNESITVRRVSYGIGIERTFPLHSPLVENVEVARKGDVRRAKLYYLRDRVGKSARIRERARHARRPEEAEAAVVEEIVDLETMEAGLETAPAEEVAAPAVEETVAEEAAAPAEEAAPAEPAPAETAEETTDEEE
jgi:large subunit ribosomal protein L19